MLPRARITQQQIKQIFEMYAEGKSKSVIAGLVGVGGDTVTRYLTKGCYCVGTINTHTTKCKNWKAQ
jgi:hypothetical protein